MFMRPDLFQKHREHMRDPEGTSVTASHRWERACRQRREPATSRWHVLVTLLMTICEVSSVFSITFCASGSSEELETAEAALLDAEAGRGPGRPGAAEDDEDEGARRSRRGGSRVVDKRESSSLDP